MASKRKGLSVEEKRSRMLDLFYEKKDFFLLKELEKIAPKEKGIVSQSVKDVVQSLVDDSLVDTDKIGTSVYFWAFPSKATASRKRKLDEVHTKVQDIAKKAKQTEEDASKAVQGREFSEERSKILEDLRLMRIKKEELATDLKKFKDCDPEALSVLKRETKEAYEAANRWTDNIFALQAWIQKNFPSIDVSDINKQFGIPQDLEEINC